MKVVSRIAGILLGLIFVVFGLNGFLHFIPMGQLPPGPAGQFIGALVQTHYELFVSGIQVIGGVLVLINRFVPLGLTLLAPVIVNILLFHILMLPTGWMLGGIALILWLIVFYQHRLHFAGLFVHRSQL